MLICNSCASPNTDDAATCVSCGAVPTIAPKRPPPVSDSYATISGERSSKPTQDRLLGTTIAGRYVIEELIGRGGMGLVYRASDNELREDIAIKVLQSGYSDDPKEVDRLKREIRTARLIAHPNVIRIHDFGGVAGGEGFVTMELLRGGTLADRLRQGVMPLRDALAISIGICQGLAAAHGKDVIHRDIKPQNVLFDLEGNPKLADFGLARLTQATAQTIGFSGTPQYMSPEMGDGREITTRSDVYSMGVLLYELFTGRLPFSADSLVRLALLHARENPPAPRSIRRDLPPALEAVVMRALEKDPQRRYAHAGELTAELKSIADGRTPVAMAAPHPVAVTRAEPSQPHPPRRGAPALVVFGVAGGVLLMLGGGLVWQTVLKPAATPNPTPVAVQGAPSPTVTAAATAHPTRAIAIRTTVATPRPLRTATSKPVRTQIAIAATPAPTAAVVKNAVLTVRAKPWVEVSIDNVVVAKETPLRQYKLAAGKHTLRFKNDSLSFNLVHAVDLAAGKELILQVDTGTGTVKVLVEK